MASVNTASKKSLELDKIHVDHQAKLNYSKKLEYLSKASKASDRSPAEISREQSKLQRGPGQLQFFEYMDYHLYDRMKYDLEELPNFLGNNLRNKIAEKANSRSWERISWNKLATEAVLNYGGVKTPESLAVISRKEQFLGSAETITSEEGLRQFLDRQDVFPLFCKAAETSLSAGIFRIERHDATHVYLHAHEPMTYAELFSDYIADEVYLVQKNLTNHHAIAPFVTAVSCVRMFNLWIKDDLVTHMAILRLAQGDSISDLRRFAGNMTCEVDPKTGKVLSLVEFGETIDKLPDHPTVPGIVGMTLPHWDALVAMNLRVATLMRPLRMQSPDFALTEDGPVCLEVNARGNFVPLQEGTMRGILDDQFRSFLSSVDLEMSDLKSKKRGFWRKG